MTRSTRVFDDLGRRAEDLKALVCPSATQLKSGELARKGGLKGIAATAGAKAAIEAAGGLGEAVEAAPAQA